MLALLINSVPSFNLLSTISPLRKFKGQYSHIMALIVLQLFSYSVMKAWRASPKSSSFMVICMFVQLYNQLHFAAESSGNDHMNEQEVISFHCDKSCFCSLCFKSQTNRWCLASEGGAQKCYIKNHSGYVFQLLELPFPSQPDREIKMYLLQPHIYRHALLIHVWISNRIGLVTTSLCSAKQNHFSFPLKIEKNQWLCKSLKYMSNCYNITRIRNGLPEKNVVEQKCFTYPDNVTVWHMLQTVGLWGTIHMWTVSHKGTFNTSNKINQHQ